MNMPFITLREAKNAYFMSGEATNEIYFFSLHEIKKNGIFIQKELILLFIIFNFKRG